MATQEAANMQRAADSQVPPESNGPRPRTLRLLSRVASTPGAMPPFAGRLGGNQEFILDRSNPSNASLLERIPDAAPNLSLKQALDLRGFAEPNLYKAATIELLGTMLNTFVSSWNSLSPYEPPPIPSTNAGIFSTTSFLGPLTGNVMNAIILTLLIYSFGAASGAHFNPLITLGTFFSRLTTLPRAVIYIAAQMAGATLAGLMLRAAQGNRDWKVGGCFMFPPATPGNAMALEIMACMLMLFLAFGVGLDPRQREVFGPALSPILVGLTLGALALAFAFSLPGYGGASMNPARCFGVYVGTRFPGWHWIHWVGAFGASGFHGVVYCLIPPLGFQEAQEMKIKRAQYNPHLDHEMADKRELKNETSAV